VVLWKIGGVGCEVAVRNADAGKDQESPQVFREEVLSKEGAEEASTLMRRPVQQ
jgi:hypothetical protein